MPFPFVLPTTSAFSFSSCLSCDSHPSLPVQASTQRGILRDALKKHKRQPPASRTGSLAAVMAGLDGYVPYLLAVDAGVSAHALVGGESITAVLRTAPSMDWRPTLAADGVPGRERPRVRIASLEYEVTFVLSTLGCAHVLAARALLQPLLATTGDFVGARDRTAAIQAASRHLLDAASVCDYVAGRAEQVAGAPPCADVAATTARSLASLALAEATLLAVTKDDPFPAAVAQGRNKSDKEWMFKAPDVPRTKAHLNARLCLAASDHAAQAAASAAAAGSGARVSPALARYMEDLRRTSRAKACRFLGVHAETDGRVAEAIGWLRAGFQALGVELPEREARKALSLSRLRKDLTDRREDRRVERETAWGGDAGRLEETRLLEMLDVKWNKMNDTINTQVVPPVNSLLAQMPSGREICTLQPYQPPALGRDVLEAMRAPPGADEDDGGELSSDDEPRDGPSAPVGAYPRSGAEYGASPGNAYY